jgi:tetratricopeptide (TPR) repeat protein
MFKKLFLSASIAAAFMPGMAVAEAAKPSTLEQARALLAEAKPKEAIALVDPIIAKAEADEAKDPEAMCPGRAADFLAAFMQKDNLNVTVTIEDDWCEAMLIKGFALSELKQKAEALTVLKKLVGHDDANPNYVAEYAFVLQTNGMLDESFANYQRVKDIASSLRDKQAKKHWRAVALRGLGYIYIERKQWDEATKSYKASLKDEPDNKVAKSELEYIKRKRPKN